MLKSFFAYITKNLVEEIHNFPLFIPVFMGIGIGYYFHLSTEPKTWVVYFSFILSVLFLIFVNLGNSSDKFKRYKVIVAFSTFKYIFKKIFKVLLFTLFFPIIGHITLFILIGGWFVSLFEYSYYLRYFAFFYDNSLMKSIIKGIKFLFSPVIKYLKKSKLFNYSESVIKTSKTKKNVSRNEWKLLIKTTKLFVNFLSKIFRKMFHNPLFNAIFFLKNLISKNLKRFFKKLKLYIKKNVSESNLNTIWNVIYFTNYIIFFIILGFFVVKLKTYLLNTNLLQNKLKNQQIIARVISTEDFENDYRLTLDNIELLKDKNIKLDKIRVKFSKQFALPKIGKFVQFEATLIPPFEPDSYGGFNFARYAYFKKLSASGRSVEGWKYMENQPENSFMEQLFFDFLNFRNKINKTIQNKTSSDTYGVIMSMMTGERYSIPNDIAENYKNAGISHLLAISGFHMTLIVGFVFFLIRFLFAFSISFSNKYNTKKIAAIFALLFSIFYLFISGARLPTQRAFIMSSLALFAIMLDRNPISLRFVAVSAIIILLFSPEALINAGFQMSFIAVIALIKLYLLKDKIFIKYDMTENIWKNRFIKILNVIFANTLSTFLIGTAIIPFVIYNFNTLQIYSVLGNFFAIPLFTFIVMPAILFSFLFMPIGGDVFFLKIVEWGIKAINYFASKISTLPYASIDVKSIELLPLLFIVFGLIWFFIWEKNWKKWGIGSIFVGILIYVFSATPAIFGNKYANIFAINEKNLNIVNFSKYNPSKMLINNWNTSIGVKKINYTENKQFKISNAKIAFIKNYKDYKKACFENNILFTTFDKSKAYFDCRKPVFDKRFFNYAKGAEFFITNSSIKYRILRKYIGKRPWSSSLYDKDDDGFPEFMNIKLFNYKS